MNKTFIVNSIRRAGPVAVITTTAVIVALFFHRELITWFGGNPDSLFGPATSSMQHDIGSFHDAGPLKVGVHIEPHQPVVGNNRLTVVVHTTSNDPVSDAEIKATAEMPAMGSMPAMRATAQMKHQSDGRYSGALDLSMAGGWPLTLVVDSPTHGQATLYFDLATTFEGLRLTSATGDHIHAAGTPGPSTQPNTSPSTQPVDGVAYYTCSMHPSVKSKDPGTCPICNMNLTPVAHEEVQTGVISVDAQRRQLIGVRTSPVSIRELEKVIRAVGIVTYDETRLTDVSLKFQGWISEMFADYTGKHVTEGQPLFTIYSPALLSAQQEYLETHRAQRVPGRNTHILESARERLLLWDLTPLQLDELIQRGKPLQYVPIVSPATGTIIEKAVVRGGAVNPGQMVYRIADLSTLWIEAELYEAELPLVKLGQTVDVSVSYLPGKRFNSTVSYIYPYLDPKTRRGRVRIEVANNDGVLKPQMYADVYITVPLGKRIAVPEEAVLYGGENNVVFLDLGEGRLRPQRVKLGVRVHGPRADEGFVEVLEGLKPGDVVVTSGNFLIASESKLKSGIEKW